MDLPVFFQTAATLSPILLGGTALAFNVWPQPRTRRRATMLALFVVVPPMIVILYSLNVLAGESSGETWRLPVLLLLQLQVLTGVAGAAGLGFASKTQQRAVKNWWRLQDKERRRERRLAQPHNQPHNQPHKPERTGLDETAQPEPVEAPDRMKPDLDEPDATDVRHS